MLDLTSLIDADAVASDGKTGCLIVPKYDEGHAKCEWDKDDPDDVKAARESFEHYKKLGYAFFRVDPKTGDKGEKIAAFDPNAGKIIAVPAFAGG